jgi:molybdopterin molybdotransferase
MALLPVAEALARILDGVTPLDAERVGLLQACGRVLASDIVAKLTQPPFDSSAMDGYAVRAADIAKVPAALAVTGESQAGRRFDGTVKAGEAVRIFTGAAVPEGADTVVIQENSERSADSLAVLEAPKPGANIRTAGGDFIAGKTVLAAGRILDAGAIMLAAAAGHARLPVRRKPLVAILATGDELIEPGAGTPGPDQIVSSNPYGLAALIERAGGAAKLLGIAGDTREALGAKLAAASGADILVTIGGASVGDRDLVRPVLEARGLELNFWKIAMRPGKPMLFGRLDGMRVLGLPGNPNSCLVTARVFLVPLIQRLLGRAEAPAHPQTAILAADLDANGPRQHYMLGSLEPGAPLRVRALASQDSGRISSLVAANVMIVRPPDAPALAAGSPVEILPIDF